MRPYVFLASALALLPATSLLAVTYYVSPNGNDNSFGFIQIAPWKTVAKVNSYKFQKGDTILFLAGGTWREELIPSTSGISFGAYGTGARPIVSGANLYTTGWTETSGSTVVWEASIGSYQPEQVWFNTVLGQPVSTTSAIIAPNQWCYLNGILYVYSKTNPGTGFTAPGVEAAQRDSALLIQGVTGTTVTGMEFVNPNYTAIDVETTAAGTQTFTNDVWQGAQYEGLRAVSGTQVVTNSEGLYNELGVGIGGGSGITINNSILSGNTGGAIEVYGTTGPTTITQSTLTGNAAANPLVATVRNYASYPMTLSKSIVLPNPTASIVSTYINVTDDGTNANTSPAFTTRAAPLVIVPFIDDYINLGVAQSVSALAHQYGCSLSYALNTKLVTPAAWQSVIAMQQAGDEIVAHTRSHSDLANNNVVTIQYTGTASTATMNINTGTGLLQTFLNGSSTPDLNIDISNTYNGMTDVCSVITTQNPSYTCVPQDNQLYFTPAILANVSNVNIKQPYLATAASNYLTNEVEGAVADIQANMPGYTVKSFATPFTSSNQTVESHIQAAGLNSNRNGILDANNLPNGNWTLPFIDVYNIGSVWIPTGFDATKPASSTAALVEGMGAAGGVIGIYAHGYDEFALAQWQTLFQNLQTFGATCMTMSQATQFIKQNGTLVPDGTNKNWVQSVLHNPNFSTTSQSPTQGAQGLH
jgi:hypothetical protein